jgi:hypothetical protein
MRSAVGQPPVQNRDVDVLGEGRFNNAWNVLRMLQWHGAVDLAGRTVQGAQYKVTGYVDVAVGAVGEEPRAQIGVGLVYQAQRQLLLVGHAKVPISSPG